MKFRHSLSQGIYCHVSAKWINVRHNLGLPVRSEWIMDKSLVSHYAYDYEMAVDKRYPALKPLKYIFRKLFPVKR